MQHTRLGRVRALQALCAAALCLPLLAQAVGLGRLVVHSGLDEPLNAEIGLLAPTPQQLKSLVVTLAPRADYTAAGIERPPHLLTIKFTVTKRADGRHVLLLTTDQPLREPYLHFLLQIEWAGGRQVREFTALLDPPNWVAGKPSGIESPRRGAVGADERRAPASPPAALETTPSSPTRAPTGTVPSTPFGEKLYGPGHLGDDGQIDFGPYTDDVKASTAPRSDWAAQIEYGPVKRGDTLWHITERIRADKSVSIEQAMLALLKTNPDAFIGNNINHLKAGKILKIPERAQIETITKPQAQKEVRVQYDAWQEYKLKLAGAERVVKVPDTAEKKSAEPAEQSGKTGVAQKKDTKPVKDKPAAADALLGRESGDDLLKIVRANLDDDKKPFEKKADGTEGKRDTASERRALSDKVATLEEVIQSKELENKELRERVGILQEQVKNTARLIELESKELAVQQKQSSELSAPTPAPAPATPPVAKTETVKAPPEKPAAAPPARKPPPPPPVEDKGLMGIVDDLMANPVILGAGAVGLVGGLGLLFAYIRRRNRAKAEFAESILSGGVLDSATPDSGAPAASDTSFLSDFSQSGMGTIHHTDEVDPIAEAEVYLAYGRDEQAEEILKDAITKDPVRHELKQKLLEIYHHRNDLRSFETLAEELYAALQGKGGKVWEKVEEMGRKMNPNNPMFGGAAAPGKPVSEPPTSTYAMPAAKKPAVAKSTAASAAISAALDETLGAVKQADAGKRTAPPPADTGLDFDLSPPAAPESPPTGDINFDLDLGQPAQDSVDLNFDAGDELKPQGARAGDKQAEELAQDDGVITFETDASESPGLDWPGAKPEGAPQAAAQAAGEKDWDETATKLDLAKAYIDMGDNEGARSILDEVIAEGSDQQKQQARELVAQMS